MNAMKFGFFFCTCITLAVLSRTSSHICKMDSNVSLSELMENFFWFSMLMRRAVGMSLSDTPKYFITCDKVELTSMEMKRIYVGDMETKGILVSSC